MKTTAETAHRLRPAALTTILIALAMTPQAVAEEGGSGHYLPGSMGTLIDLVPTKPGWVLESVYLHYSGDASVSANLPVAGLLTVGLDASSDAFLLGGFHTFEPQVLGAFYSVGAFVPYVWMDVEAQVVVGPGPVTAYRSSTESGLGDITLLPLLMAWKQDCWQFNAALPIYAPTGDYQVGRLANPGKNHWTFDPTIGAAYSNEQTGLNFAVHTGVALSTENNDTNYRNGAVFHIDASVQQLLPVGPGILGLGVEAFYLDQVSGDRGPGSGPNGFQGRSAGLGPVLSYILPVGENTLVAELRWLAELDTKRRMEGDYIWFKMVYQF